MKFIEMSQKGFSLVQGMILSGVLAGSALVATKMLNEQKKVQKSAETRDQIDDLHKIVYSALQNRKNCERTIIDQSATASIIGAGVTPLDQILNTSTADPIVVKRFVPGPDLTQIYMNGNVIVKDMFLSGYNAASGTTTLSIVYERMAGKSGTDSDTKRTKDGFGAKDIRKNIILRVQRDPFNTTPIMKPFESCYATTDSAGIAESEQGNKTLSERLCNEMNGDEDLTDGTVIKDANGNAVTGQRMWIWDESSATCLPNAKCPPNEIYTGVDSTGDVKCTSIKEWGLDSLIEPGSIGDCSGAPGKQARLEINPGTNKVQIVCGVGGAGLPDGASCYANSSRCGLPDTCGNCTNPPLTTCGPDGWARCGMAVDSSPGCPHPSICP